MHTMHDSQIVRMLNDISTKEGGGVDLCPTSMEKEIDATNDFVYDKVKNCSALVQPSDVTGRERQAWWTVHTAYRSFFDAISQSCLSSGVMCRQNGASMNLLGEIGRDCGAKL